jgi:hypothetical protein
LRGSAGCQEGGQYKKVMQQAIKRGSQYMNPSQYTKGFSIAAIKKVQNIQ